MKKQIKTLFIAMSLFAVPLGVSLPTFSCKTKLSLEQFEEYKKNINSIEFGLMNSTEEGIKNSSTKLSDYYFANMNTNDLHAKILENKILSNQKLQVKVLYYHKATLTNIDIKTYTIDISNGTSKPDPAKPDPGNKPDPGSPSGGGQNTGSSETIIDVDPSINTTFLNFNKTQKWTSIKYSKIKYNSSNNYYAQAEGLKGAQLFEKILQIQKSKVGDIGSGTSAYNKLWSTYAKAWTDKFLEDDGTILDIYSENPNGKDPYNFRPGVDQDKGNHSKESDSYNREHMIPQSWFGKDTYPTRADCHFIFPTDAWVNQERGNSPHFWVKGNAYITKNGTKIDRNHYTEVIDFFKGDTARAYFYFQITHKNANQGGGPQVFKNPYPYFQEKFLECYRIWNKFDPVDACEIYRNNEIAKAQGGLRNPFIDYPNLVKLIFDTNNTETFKNLGVAESLVD